jgi:hypothetical protein
VKATTDYTETLVHSCRRLSRRGRRARLGSPSFFPRSEWEVHGTFPFAGPDGNILAFLLPVASCLESEEGDEFLASLPELERRYFHEQRDVLEAQLKKVRRVQQDPRRRDLPLFCSIL